jgi:hypothetical protein
MVMRCGCTPARSCLTACRHSSLGSWACEYGLKGWGERLDEGLKAKESGEGDGVAAAVHVPEQALLFGLVGM